MVAPQSAEDRVLINVCSRVRQSRVAVESGARTIASAIKRSRWEKAQEGFSKIVTGTVQLQNISNEVDIFISPLPSPSHTILL